MNPNNFGNIDILLPNQAQKNLMNSNQQYNRIKQNSYNFKQKDFNNLNNHGNLRGSLNDNGDIDPNRSNSMQNSNKLPGMQENQAVLYLISYNEN